MPTAGQSIEFHLNTDDTKQFIFIKPIGGAQSKSLYSGCYVYDNKFFYIKSSKHYPADDVAEVYSAGLFKKLTSGLNSYIFADCKFINGPDGNRYILSPGLNNWKNLSTIAQDEQAKKQENYLSQTLRLFSLERFFGSTKDTLVYFILENPNDTMEEITRKARLRQELSEILLLCYLVGDYDVQPENIGNFIGDDGFEHFGKIDHGWAFASLTAINQNQHPDITETIFIPFGKLGTHTLSFIPSNNFNNFLPLFDTNEFLKATIKITSLAFISKFIEAMESNIRLMSINDLKLFGEHCGIPNPDINSTKSPEELQTLIIDKLTLAIKSRAVKLIEKASLQKHKSLLLSESTASKTTEQRLQPTYTSFSTKDGFEYICGSEEIFKSSRNIS